MLYDDYPNNQVSTNVTLLERVRTLCESLNFRIFQESGRYYLIQTEVYQFSLGCKFTRYTRDSVSSNFQPVDLSKGSLTNNDITVSNSNNRPLVSGGKFSYLPAVKKVEVNFKSTTVPFTASRMYEYVGSVEYPSQVNDLPKKETRNIPSSGTLDVADFAFTVFDSVFSPRTAVFQRRNHATPTPVYTGLSVQCLAQANADNRRNHVRTMSCKITTSASGRYDIYKKFNYDGVDWIWTEISYSAEMDEWDGDWVALQHSEEVAFHPEYKRIEINVG
jgi:hypothetical protein